MKVDYLLSSDALKMGAKIHYNHKVIKKYVLFISGIGLIPAYMMYHEANYVGIAFLYLILFCLIPVNRFFYTMRVAKNAFKAKPAQIPHTISVTDTGLDFSVPTASSSTTWENFVSVIDHPSGILIYPQKNIFFFIPSSSTITDGTWQDFTELLEVKIQKKV